MKKVTRTFKEVDQVLSENVHSHMTGVSPRDSDTELFIQILQRFHGAQFDARQMNTIREVKFESMSRARRKLQEGGQYLPSPAVAKRRRLASYELQQVAPTESASGVQRRIEEA